MHTKRVLAVAVGAVLSAALLSGCASNQLKNNNANEIANYQSQLKQEQAQNAQLQQQLNAQPQAAAPSAQNYNELYPPTAKPGECYARVVTPAKFENVSNQVETREASEKLSVVPATYQWVEKRVLDHAAYKKLVVVPATYTTKTQQIEVSPESTELMPVPAQYTTKTTRVVDVPQHTIWHRGKSLLPGAIASRVDSTTGDIMCLINVPATYKTMTQTVLVSPATVTKTDIPAQYKTVTQRVVATPATTSEITVPATYKTVRVKELVSAASTNKVAIPAEYRTVTSRKLVSPGQSSWQRVVCKTNMTPELARDLQTTLQSKGYYKGRIDGIYGPLTMSAVSGYARANSLPSGKHFITYSVIKSLNVAQP